jgi:hypothetical protein
MLQFLRALPSAAACSHRQASSLRRSATASLLGLTAALGCSLAAGASLAEPQAPGADTASPTNTALVPPPPPVMREVLLELGKRQISLMEGSQVLGRWPVAIGDASTPTPVGRFTIENMVVNPVYQSTSSGKINNTVGPQAPLGDRWIGFKQSGVNQYGIHGTPDAWAWTVTSRAAVSNGCVRMLTPHVRELFSKVQVGTPVIVKP